MEQYPSHRDDLSITLGRKPGEVNSPSLLALQGLDIIACGEAQRNHRKTNRSDGFSHRWDDFNRSIQSMNRINPVPTIAEAIATEG